MDIDESAILYWIEKSLNEKRFLIYSQEFTEWEMLPGYFFYLIGKMGILRLGPALLGLSELIVLWFLARRLLSTRGAWITVAFVALCPWHFYYSRIVGTCTGVSLLILLSLYLKDSKIYLKAPLYVIGIFYYATYRLLLIRLIIENTLKKRWKETALIFGALLFCLLMIGLSESTLSQFFTRGTYNFDKPKLSLLSHYFFTAIAPFTPVLKYYAHTTDTFMADYVHAGFTFALGNHPPLGWGFSLTLILLVLHSLKGKIRKKKSLRMNPDLKAEVYFVIGSVMLLGFMGPSFSRFLFVVPFLGMFAAWAFEILHERTSKRNYQILLVLALLTTFWSQLHLLTHLGSKELMEPVFHPRHQELSQYVHKHLPQANEENVFILTDFGHQSARYWKSQSQRYTLLPALSPRFLMQKLLSHSKGEPQTLITDKVPSLAEKLSGYDKTSRIQNAIGFVRKHALVLEEKEIHWRGRTIGHLIRVRWPKYFIPR